MKELLNSHFLGVEHQSSHVIIVGYCSKTWTKVGPCFIPERSIPLQCTCIYKAKENNFKPCFTLSWHSLGSEFAETFSWMHVPRNVAAIKTLAVVTITIRTASNTLYINIIENYDCTTTRYIECTSIFFLFCGETSSCTLRDWCSSC